MEQQDPERVAVLQVDVNAGISATNTCVERTEKSSNDVDEVSVEKTSCFYHERDDYPNLTESDCAQLEAEPVRTNTQLLSFEIRSRDIDWKRFVIPLDTTVRSEGYYLEQQADFVSKYRIPLTSSNRREMLVCHDMMGNYLADRHFLSSEKWDDYRFVHWAAVDYFCYFSHNYVTIPPCGWINAAHRHGVPIVGTYIVERSSLLEEALTTIEKVDHIVAALIKLCKHFGFEGWLVNVECKVRPEYLQKLIYFVRQLRVATEAEIPHGRVFWYDSVINTGELLWQNELNERNIDFYRCTNNTLINYGWNDASLAKTAATLRGEHASLHSAFFGLDVFGRNQVGRFQSAATLKRIADAGFSIGIFAPGWSFETLQQYGYNIRNEDGDEAVNSAFLSRNDRWWWRLWEFLATHPYRKLPFYTDFCVGSGRASYQHGLQLPNSKPFLNLSRQSLQPSVPLKDNATHSFTDVYGGGNSLRITNYERAFRLFLTEFSLPLGAVLLGYAYKAHDSTTLDVVLRFSAPKQQEKDLYVFCGNYSQHILAAGRCYISPLNGANAQRFEHSEIPALENTMANGGWRTRYYLVQFDGPVMLKDIGLRCGRSTSAATDTFLGAIYLQSMKLQDAMWPQIVDEKANIEVYRQQMWS
ncbi:cytosolic endo-beta-N-acetylglucosaminidase-like [Scaptodrosophila lebanonensis]|uniref:Cytosolic endo-beta-N-acetylglucosaminidase-like n=1 Tax=Drosophila lebanonensis TaxID=7225 RepID=A0A6J2TS64_DROLE|nr:cytosolic endo-beta-N-acetylglucosaminidase-like [Scaptodrosophila lebanonensis]